ncbi:hypothetical protein BDAP_001909 [Binucleata daphniae]
MTVFMTPYLIEKKKFTNKEIFNKITPFFFVSSLFASFFGPVLVSFIGNKYTLLFETGLELITYFIFYFMPERSFFYATLTGLFHGIVTSLGSLTKGILLEHKPDRFENEVMYRDHNTIKKSCGVLSSWIGQDIKSITQSHQANLVFSFVTLLSSLGLCAKIPDTGIREKKSNLASIIFSRDAFTKIRDIYTNQVLYFSILNIIGSTLYICFAMYSANIFIARKKEVDPSVLLLGKVMHRISIPVRLISRVIVFFVRLIDRSIHFNPTYDKNAVIFGYIDGLAKLVSAIFSFLMSLTLQKSSFLDLRCFISSICVILFTFLMGKTESLMKSYIIFILGSVASQTSLIWSYNGLTVDKSDLHIILGLNLVASSLIHISVSYISKVRNSELNSKVLMYFYVSSALLLTAGGLRICDML